MKEAEMRKAILMGMAVAATAIAGCARDRAEASAGPATTRDFQVAGFERLEVGGPYEVTVTTGSAPSVRASGGEQAIERMVVEVVNGTLRIHPKKRSGMNLGWSGSIHPVKLAITVPRLTAAQIAGSGNIAVDKIAGDSFDAGIAGSGALRLGQVDVKRLKAEIAGSGEINAGQGRASVVDYGIAGSGGIDAGAIVAEVASVSIAGSGEVAANATGSASVDIAGSGDVRMSGGAKCTVSKAGSGNVHCS
jgi:hypothetical protein